MSTRLYQQCQFSPVYSRCDLHSNISHYRYRSGPLLDLVLDFLGKNTNVRALYTADLSPLRGLERFVTNLLINTHTTGRRTKVIRGLVPNAGNYAFDKDGQTMTVHVSAPHWCPLPVSTFDILKALLLIRTQHQTAIS